MPVHPVRPTDVPPVRQRRVLRTVARLGGGACLLGGGLLLALHTGPARQFALNRAVAFLASRQIEARAGELRYNLLTLSIEVRQLQLRSAASADLPVFASVARAKIDLSLPEVLRGRMLVESALAEDVHVDYIVDANGRDNLPPLPGSSAAGAPDYLIANLALTGARVRYANLPQRVDVVASLSSATMTGNLLTGRHRIRFEGSDGRIQFRNHAAPLERIAGVLDLGRDDVRVERLQVESLGSRVTVSGLVRALAAPSFGLALHGSVDAGRTAAVLGVPDPIGGRLAVDATIEGPVSTPAVDARVSGAHLRFGSLGGVTLDARAAYDAAARIATLSSARLDAPWGRLAASGQLSLDRERTSRVRAQIDDLALAALMQEMNLPHAVRAQVDGHVDAEWPGLDYLEASGQATAMLTPASARPSRRVMPVGGSLSTRRRGGTTTVDLKQITAAGAQLTGQVQIGAGGRLDGRLQAVVPDLARTAADAKAFLASGGSAPAPISGAATVDARLGGTVAAPVARVTAGAQSVSVGGAAGVAIAADLVVTPAAVTIARGEATWRHARADVTGSIGLRAGRMLDLVLRAETANLQPLVHAAYPNAAAPVSGTVAAHGTLRGTADRPVGNLAVTGADIVAFGERFGSLNADVALVGHEITVSRLALEKPQPDGPGRISATGSYDLRRSAYRLDLQSENVQLLAMTLPGGQRLGGTLELSAHGAGTIASPTGTVHLSIDSLAVDGWRPPGGIVIAATVANHEAVINASAEGFNLDANGMVGLARPWPTSLKLRANDLPLERLPLNFQTPYEGRLRATVDAAGDLAQMARGRATAEVEALSGSWNGHPFSVTSAGALRYENERLAIGGLELTASGSSLKVAGDLPLSAAGPAGEVTVEARADLATLSAYLPPDASVTGAGVATLAGALRGTLASIAPDFVVTVANGAVSSPRLGPGAADIQLRARVADGAARVEQLTSRWGTATIEAAGTIPFDILPGLPVQIPRGGGPATITASVRGLDPADIPGVPAGVTGRVGVDLEASARGADLDALTGHMTFTELDLAFNRLTLSQQQPSSIRMERGITTVERLALAGSAGNIAASGTVAITGARALDLNVDGTVNVAALSALTSTVRTDGTATCRVAARGTLTAPELHGTFDLADATVASDELGVAAVNVEARADLEGTRLTLARLAGEVNGGTFEGAGSVALAGGGISDADLQVTVRGFAYDAPLDLRSLSDSTIRVSRQGDQFVVAGQVTISEAGLTSDVRLDDELFAAIGAPRTRELAEVRNPLLERVRFEVDVDTATPIVIENNLARAEIDADLRVVGTPYEPGLTGRITLAEGGQVTLNARRYEVERGVITFVDHRRIVPSIDLALNTKASNYDVRIALNGAPGKIETSWTSAPPLPETDIMALLVTGRTVDEMRGEESEVARVQALSYLTGRLGSRFGRGLERAGISEVRIEPVLIANETDPTARLTVGQNLTDRMKLVYSTNLADSNDQIWVAEYDVTRRFQIRAVREREDDNYRGDFRHDLRFGGEPAPRRQLRLRPPIDRLTVTSDDGADEALLRRLFKVEVGDTYDYFAARRGLERIDEHLLEAGYVQSRVRLVRDIRPDGVGLTLEATRGPVVALEFEGATPPSKVRQEVRTAWHHGVFDRQRGNDGARAITAWLIREKHLQPRVEHEITSQPGRRTAVFRIQPGPRYDKVVLVFEGASLIDPDRLDKVIEDEGLEHQLFTDPATVTELLLRYYRAQGFLSAEIDAPRYEFDEPTARVVLAVREGNRFAVGKVTATGNRVFTSAEIMATLPLAPDTPFMSDAAGHAVEKIRELYWRRGYNDVHTEYALVVDRGAARVDINLTIAEGRQSIVSGITVEGNRKTSERLVRGQLELTPSAPLDLAVLARSRQNLYSTGAFSIADITRHTRESDALAAPGADAGVVDSATEKPVDLTVSVREVQPVQLRYGLSYDTESGLGGILDFSVHNSLGRARVFGMQGRYDSEIHEARVYVSQPSLRTWPRKTTASAYFREDLNPPTEQTDPFDISRQGGSIQQEAQFRKYYVWSYGYRYELATTLEPSLGAGVTETVRVTPLSTTLTRETRDEVLDASRGTFLSQAFAYSPSWLGSDRPYLKYYGQYFHYFPLRRERTERFTGEVLRTRLVLAAGARVGFARGLGGDVPTSERFYAGGSTTLRGFEQNAVGPIGVNNVPAGGNAVLVLNSELRMPLVRFLDGAVFLDVGNVYPTISDFSLTDLRESAGVGIRIRTPWILLRSDYGWVLDPRPGERRSRFYLSIGQAF